MGDAAGSEGASVTRGADPRVSSELTDAFATARALLAGAEAEAGRVRSDADTYARARKQEADLLVAKARRVLGVAEDKAAAIIATARVEGGRLAAATVGAGPAPERAVGRVIAPGASALPHGVDPASTGDPSRIDRMLAQAIARAVEDAFEKRTG